MMQKKFIKIMYYYIKKDKILYITYCIFLGINKPYYI